MKMAVAFLAISCIALFSTIGYIAYEEVRADIAYDIVRACVEQNGASRVCTITYDTDRTYLAISVGDEVVYCRTGGLTGC